MVSFPLKPLNPHLSDVFTVFPLLLAASHEPSVCLDKIGSKAEAGAEATQESKRKLSVRDRREPPPTPACSDN